MTNLIIREDGSQIDKTVILSCEHESQVNISSDFTFGCAVPDCITVRVKGDIASAVSSGEKLTYYQVKDDGTQKKIGVFYAETPTITSKDSYSFVAYDSISLLDKDISSWLYENNQKQGYFPIRIDVLVGQVCELCGVTFKGYTFPNYRFPVNAFYADHITGRDILSAAAELAGRFVKADADGNVYFGWFAENTTTDIAPGKNEAADGVTRIPYFQGQLTFQNYTTTIVDRVQIQRQEDDIGLIYPSDATGVTYQVTGNILTNAASDTWMTTIAKSLLSTIQTMVYTPFTVKVPKTNLIKAGDIITVIDINGNTFKSPVFKVTTDSSGTTIETVGTESRESGYVANVKKYKNLYGKVLSLETSFEGLRATASDLSGKVASFEVEVKKIDAKVSSEYSGSSFGWTLASTGWSVEGNGSEIFRIDRYGAYVNGEIVADSGSIGDLNINSYGLSAYGIELTSNGLSCGWGSFSVDNNGYMTANKCEISGDIYSYRLFINVEGTYHEMEAIYVSEYGCYFLGYRG